MLHTVALVQYIFTLVPISITVIYLCRIFYNKPLTTLWKESSPVAMLFVAIILMLGIDAVMGIEWILLLFNVISNDSESSALLGIPVLLRVGIQLLFAISNSAIYAQRIYILIYPLKPIRRANKVIFWLEMTITVIAAAFAVIPNIPSSWNFTPAPEGCYSPNCSNLLPGRRYSASTTLVLSTCTVLLGGSFQYLYYRYRTSKRSTKPETLKLHRFARYSFYIRLVFETIPYIIDTFFTNVVGVKIGTYIGPYGLVATCLDYCASTFVYYTLVIKKRAQVGNVNSLGDTSN
ncbi:hypothetical protein QR680_015979 [Steinernema hermaphroditum]|uniref:Uncharacterized protein n=1 Tax=Steinernema hermaphroditum TaxID=289476 RepID=A0AA39H9M0_9BILA|nr:hypothetical protein QR680_015979 [Steinernema hermaphroditum]